LDVLDIEPRFDDRTNIKIIQKNNGAYRKKRLDILAGIINNAKYFMAFYF